MAKDQYKAIRIHLEDLDEGLDMEDVQYIIAIIGKIMYDKGRTLDPSPVTIINRGNSNRSLGIAWARR